MSSNIEILEWLEFSGGTYIRHKTMSLWSLLPLNYSQRESCCVLLIRDTLLCTLSLIEAATPPEAFLLNSLFFVISLKPEKEIWSNSSSFVSVINITS